MYCRGVLGGRGNSSAGFGSWSLGHRVLDKNHKLQHMDRNEQGFNKIKIRKVQSKTRRVETRGLRHWGSN